MSNTLRNVLFAHESGEKMPPDIFTKMLSDKNKWKKARWLINMVSPSELKDVVPVHCDIHSGILEKTAMPATCTTAITAALSTPSGDGVADDIVHAASSPGGGRHTTFANMITNFALPRSKHAVDPISAELNTKVKFDKEDHLEMLNAVLSKEWPLQARTHVAGKDGGRCLGSCVGATFEKGVARLGQYTMRYNGLVRYLNTMLIKYFTDFKWASIQINVNTVSGKH